MFVVDDLLLGLPFLFVAWRAARAAKAFDTEQNGKMTPDMRSMLVPGAASHAGDGSIIDVRGVSKLSPEDRVAVIQAANELEIPVDSLATVIALESAWKSSALNSLPAAGLIQITTGANLPGFNTPDAVLTVAEMSVPEQLQKVVIPYYRRFGAGVRGVDASTLYIYNFLPAVAGSSDDRVIGVRRDPPGVGPNGETPDTRLTPNAALTLGSVYAWNSGFDREKKGYFTVGDVRAFVNHVAAEAHGRRVMVDGSIVDGGVKTVGGCGSSFREPSYRDASTYKTVGGCGGNYASLTEHYPEVEPPDVQLVKVVGGSGRADSDGMDYSALFEPEIGPYVPAPVSGAGDGYVPVQLGDEVSEPLVFDSDEAAPDEESVPDQVDAVPAEITESDEGGGTEVVDDVTGQEVFANVFGDAREVFEESDAAYPQSADGGAHTTGGWGETFDPQDPWRHTRTVGGSSNVTPEQAAVIKRGIVEAVKQGDFDTPQWTQLRVGDYELMVMNEPLAVHGLRLPTSFDDMIVISNLINAMPITPVISDARFASAKKLYAPSQGLGDPRGALHNDPEQIVKYNEMLGANTGEFRDGFWKEIVLSPRLTKSGKGSMAQYGFKTSDTHMFEHGGPSNHFKEYKDYSDTPTYVSRRAVKYDAQGNATEVDLLDEIASGALGGPIPDWLVRRIRTGEVNA